VSMLETGCNWAVVQPDRKMEKACMQEARAWLAGCVRT
jgi:hypothetical protein